MDDLAPTAAVPQEIERDTAEAEDAYKISDLIFPPTSFLFDQDLVSFSVNNKLLRGWVKQPSPCCAAAAVAGAWNALGGMDRSHPAALHHSDVIAMYVTILKEQIERLSQSFERKLGGGPFQILYDAVANEMAIITAGTTVGDIVSKKEKKVSKLLVSKAVKAAIKKYKSSIPASLQSEAEDANEAILKGTLHPLLCLEEILNIEAAEAKLRQEEEVLDGSRRDIGHDADNNDDDDGDFAENGEEEEEAVEEEIEEKGDSSKLPPVPATGQVGQSADAGDDDVVVCGSGNAAGTVLKKKSFKRGKTPSSKPSSSIKWNWRFELAGIFNKLRGLRRLEHPTLPSTTIIGNWGILDGVTRLSEQRGLGSTGFQAILLMGKKSRAKSKIEAPLSASDSEEKITQQWNILRSAFQRDDSVILFHLKNHYALIYALKEWVEEAEPGCGVYVHKRQILTARKGQRPSAWIDFEEARSCMIGWEGYKMMVLTRAKDVKPIDLQNSTNTIAESRI